MVYSLTNFRTVTALFIPIVQEERLLVRSFIQPVEEGILIYTTLGFDTPDFIERLIDVPRQIGKRIDVIVDWFTAGLRT